MSGVERGPLPHGWRWAKLGEATSINPRREWIERADDALTTFVPMSALEEGTGVIVRPELRPYGKIKRGYTAFRDGDVLFAKITPCMENGKHAIATNLNDGIGFGTTEFHVLRPQSDVLTEWIHAYVRQPSLLQAAAKAFTGAVGQQRVPPEFLSELAIPVPPLSEQRRITNLLDAAMAERVQARESAQAQSVDLTRLESRALLTLLRREVSANEGAPDGWRWHELTDVARLESGHTPSRRHPEWWGGQVPWIALPDIRALDGREAHHTIERTNEEGLANSSARLLPAGTVVLSRTASVGYVTVMGRPMATSQDFVNWVCGAKLTPWFLAYVLIASRERLRALSEGAIHKTIYMPTLRSLRICVPPLVEQASIVSKIDDLRRRVSTARTSAVAQLAAIDALPGAMLSAAFRGDL